jgi:hypothetical protein
LRDLLGDRWHTDDAQREPEHPSLEASYERRRCLGVPGRHPRDQTVVGGSHVEVYGSRPSGDL